MIFNSYLYIQGESCHGIAINFSTMKKVLTSALMLAMLPAGMHATNSIGYSDGNVGRTTIFRTATDKTGLAVRIPAEKVRFLAGRTITGLEIAVGSKQSTDSKISVFVSESLGGEAKASEVFDISRANAWETYEFAEPYTITGDEDGLYIGYTLDIPSTYLALSADMSSPMDGVTYALFDDEWRDIYEMAVGQGNIRALLDTDPEMTDLLVKPLQFSGYYKEGNAYSFSGELFNFGTKPVDSFSISLQVGNEQPQTYDIPETLEPGASYTFSIPEYTAHETGELDVRLEVTAMNGGADDDPTDNVGETTLFFYPADMERAILLEEFTGQDCSSCPAGHRTVESVTESWSANPENPEIINVAHHSGYFPDDFTMNEDLEYTCFYAGGTFAPAVMVNRLRNNSQNAPVFNVGEALLTSALEAAAATMPYVSLNLESVFDPDTRKLDVKVQAYTFNEIPEQIRTLNVMLCQDNIVGRQAGLGVTDHNHVFRGALTGNAWGVQRPLSPGTVDSYEVSYTIPENITSSYSGTDIQAVPEDMYLVAYASVYDENNVNKRYILNCAKVRLGESKQQQGFVSGVRAVSDAGRNPVFSVEGGRISADVDCRSMEVYDAAGALRPNVDLPAGLYIVRAVTASGNVFSAKVVVR